MSFLNKINVFLWFNMIKQVFNRKSNKALVSYIIKINTLHQDVLLVLVRALPPKKNYCPQISNFGGRMTFWN